MVEGGNALHHVKRGNCPGWGNVRGICPGECSGKCPDPKVDWIDYHVHAHAFVFS